MAFVVPEMPLTAAIWDVDEAGTLTLRTLAACNVAFGKRVITQLLHLLDSGDEVFSNLLFPRGTDVRDSWSQGVARGDYVEVPEGTGRWYYVLYVNDLGQGFPNEHRFAVCTKTTVDALWPAPLPPVWGEEPRTWRRIGDKVVLKHRRATVRA